MYKCGRLPHIVVNEVGLIGARVESSDTVCHFRLRFKMAAVVPNVTFSGRDLRVHETATVGSVLLIYIEKENTLLETTAPNLT